MTDVFTRAKRSEVMSRIRGFDTAPEVDVRSLLHQMGYRFRLHARNLPGRPDIVLPRFHTVMFAHGCFWHRHRGCNLAYTPKSRTGFWLAKFKENVARDRRVHRQLLALGWQVVTVWQCELRDREGLGKRLRTLLEGAWGQR